MRVPFFNDFIIGVKSLMRVTNCRYEAIDVDSILARV